MFANNGGGNDPNDLLPTILTDRNFQENKQAWITF
jgi:hypothetical protein